jgi:hypothetical protein
MKKTIVYTVIASALAAGAYLVFAAENEQPMIGGGMMHGRMMDANQMPMHRGMGRGGMMDVNDMMMRGGMMGMHPMMYSSSLVATTDGGVVVMMGNKLIKYDKDLNLVKEVEIKIDWQSWNKTMMEHRKMMMGQ